MIELKRMENRQQSPQQLTPEKRALFYYEKKGNYVQRGERLPREIVKTDGVRINQEVTPQMPSSILANDYENLRIFFLGGPGSIEEIVPPNAHRGVVIELNQQNILGTYPMALFGKGNGESKRSLAIRSMRIDPLTGLLVSNHVENTLAHSPTPEGLMEEVGAKWDWDISMLLLREGARVAIPVAMLPLDAQALGNWGMEHIIREGSQYPLDAAVRKIRRAKDVPVLYYRYGDDVRISDITRSNREGIYSNESVMKRAAESFQSEISLLGNPQAFFDKYGIKSIDEFDKSLHQLADGNFTEKAVLDYARVLAAIIGFNYGVYKRVAGKFAKEQLGYRLITPNSYHHYQDIGITGRQHDFEVQAVTGPVSGIRARFDRRLAKGRGMQRGAHSADDLYRALLEKPYDKRIYEQFREFAQQGFEKGLNKPS